MYIAVHYFRVEGTLALAAALHEGGDRLHKLRIVEGGNKAAGACGDEGVIALVRVFLA